MYDSSFLDDRYSLNFQSPRETANKCTSSKSDICQAWGAECPIKLVFIGGTSRSAHHQSHAETGRHCADSDQNFTLRWVDAR